MTAPSILDLVGQHPILVPLAGYLSTLDLFHLALTSRYCYALILGSPEVFSVLKRQCLCDGRGLRRRLAACYRGEDSVSGGIISYKWGNSRKIHRDEEIEVQLFARRCDEAGALPCVRCGINVCEECRSCPRTIPEHGGLGWRPHLNPSWQLENIMCLCTVCDAAMEEWLRGQFLHARCDCDIYRRWICRTCSVAEECEKYEYIDKHTEFEGEERTKQMVDHQHSRSFYCPCGSDIPQDMVPRCFLCKRRHRPEAEWTDEYQEAETNIPPHVDGGGSYPIYTRDYDIDIAWEGYPRLGYQGPIYSNTDQSRNAVALPLLSSQRKQGPMAQIQWSIHSTAGGWP